MAKVSLTIDQIKSGKYVLNVESVELTQDQSFRLCGDNPELRLELTAQKEIIGMPPAHSKTGMRIAEMDEYGANGAKLGFLIYPPQRQVYIYRPDQTPQCLDNPQSVPGDPELPGFTLDQTEIWQ